MAFYIRHEQPAPGTDTGFPWRDALCATIGVALVASCYYKHDPNLWWLSFICGMWVQDFLTSWKNHSGTTYFGWKR